MGPYNKNMGKECTINMAGKVTQFVRKVKYNKSPFKEVNK
jgi:hypothetical protein